MQAGKSFDLSLSDVIILCDGKSLDERDSSRDKPAAKVDNGSFTVDKSSGNIQTKKAGEL